MKLDLTDEQVERLTHPPTWKSYDTDADHHERCAICKSRITITKNYGEVGHKFGCPRRPPGLPRGSGGGYHKVDDGEHDVDRGRGLIADGGWPTCPIGGHRITHSGSHDGRTERVSPCGHVIPLGGGRRGE